MEQAITKGQRLLAAFTAVLYERDPMCFGQTRKSDAYEIEALSALARFNEMHVGLLCCDDSARFVADAIVTTTFEKWFGKDPPVLDAAGLAQDLLTAYLAERA